MAREKTSQLISLIIIFIFIILGPLFVLIPLYGFGAGFDLPPFVFLIVYFFLGIWELPLIISLIHHIKRLQEPPVDSGNVGFEKYGDISKNTSIRNSMSRIVDDHKGKKIKNTEKIRTTYFDCPYCGERVSMDSDHCSHCGNQL
ncbi:MAG: hypothetical protein GF364_13780 [Candidatus Lokiarchaeota archaeon]|nr:hypothetical protein [Candidatus Lokiarchaeota archaeon]